jgi:hypothetical protein
MTFPENSLSYKADSSLPGQKIRSGAETPYLGTFELRKFSYIDFKLNYLYSFDIIVFEHFNHSKLYTRVYLFICL